MNLKIKSCQEKILDSRKSLLYDKQGDADGKKFVEQTLLYDFNVNC